jgi:hypothetical protein
VTEYVALTSCGHLFLESPAQYFLLYLPDMAVDKASVNRIQYAQFRSRNLLSSGRRRLDFRLFSEPPREPVATTEAQLFHGGER